MDPIITNEFLSRIELIHLSVKDNVSGLFGGTHRNKNKGSSCEFADHKLYETGDDVHRIDYNLYARTDELYIKQFLDERQMHNRIYIDGSTSMNYHEKSTYAIKLAATLAYLSTCALDKTSLYVIHGKVSEEVISKLSGKDSFLNKINRLNNISFEGECFLSEAILASENVGYGDGLSIFISDFLTDNDYKKAIDYLRSKKRQVLLLQVLAPDEINPRYNGRFHFFDSENSDLFFKKNINAEVLRAYQKALEYVQHDLTTYCQSREADYLMVNSGETLESFVFSQAMKRGVLR